MKCMKVALVYDRINKWGGAERVLLALHQMYPNASVFTSVYHPKKANWAVVFQKKGTSQSHVATSFLQRFPFAISSHEWYPILMPLAFESFSFDAYDLVISITSEAAKGILTKAHTKHINYCLTPTRYLWSGYKEYFHHPVMKAIAKPAVSYLRSWDRIAAKRPDAIVAISQEVRKRIKMYYGHNAVVIYPPVTLRNIRKQNIGIKEKGYFLCVSRLVPYKKIDLAIQACNKLSFPLKIIGEGSASLSLRRIAGPTVEFLGHVSDTRLAQYYANSRGLIFPGIEDFGLVMVEAQQFGVPVLAFKGGGALETVIEGKTGLFFPSQTVQSLTAMLKKFAAYQFDSKISQINSAKYSFRVFKRKFKTFVDSVM